MTRLKSNSRREFIKRASVASAGFYILGPTTAGAFAQNDPYSTRWLKEVGYGQVEFTDNLQQEQFNNTQAVLMSLSEDSLLKPFRLRAGMAAPGDDLGGWYDESRGYDPLHGDDHGFAPGATFGQWVSALARGYAVNGSAATRDKVNRLLQGYSRTIGEEFYTHFRFPAYTYDKLVLGLIDAHQFCRQKDAYSMLERTTNAALPHLPERALDRGEEMCARPHEASGPKDESFCWDESYTLPENLFLAYQRGAGERYRSLGRRYLKDDTYFGPLAEGKNVLPGRHAYSYMNALSSAMQAYMTLGSRKHLRAAGNAFDLIQKTQSFATGGWGPDEMFVGPDSGGLGRSLIRTHNNFETPCGAYAHFKLTRYLLRVTRQARYGDSMEQVMYNTVLGANPLKSDGRAFYYSDYNFEGRKAYYRSAWPCCSGTLPQIAADYRISTYFQSEDGVYVNLYIPSTFQWEQHGARISLQQSGEFPLKEQVLFRIKASSSREFTLALRVPAWAGAGASVRVNGRRVQTPLAPGSFAMLRRAWRSGDSVDLELPMALRVQPVDAQHPETVALSYGPLVLFAVKPETQSAPRVTQEQLLKARRSGTEWRVETEDASVRLLAFTEIGQEEYSTYMNTERQRMKGG